MPRTDFTLENTLKRKEAQLARVRSEYDMLNYECQTLRSMIDMLAQEEPDGSLTLDEESL